MDSSEPLKTQLHSKLNDFSSLTRSLLELINVEKPPPPSSSGPSSSDNSLSTVLDKLIESDKEIQELVETAIQMKHRQHEIDWYDNQIEARKIEIEDIQNRLFDVEKLLELTVHQGKQKLESLEQAQQGAVSPEQLIKYAHKISQASTAVSPVGWQPSDPRRPYPQDVEMKAGILGRLSSTGKLTTAANNDDQTEGSTAAAAKEGSLGGFVGMNQNNNQSIAMIKKLEPGVTSAAASYQMLLQTSGGHIEQEPMSEDTSLSSSDEGM